MNDRFKSNPKIDALAEAYYQIASKCKPGGTVPWSLLGGEHYNEANNWYCILKMRKRLQNEDGIITRCDPGVGLVLLTDEQAARRVPAERQRRAYRQMSRGIRELSKVNTSALSLHERRAAAMRLEQMKHNRLHAGRFARDAEKTIKTETQPRRPTK